MYKDFDSKILVQQMREAFPGSRTDMEAKATEYYNLTTQLIREGFLYGTDVQLKKNQIPIDLNRLTRKLGYIRRGESRTWLSWFLQTQPLFKIVQLGYHFAQGSNRTMIETDIPIEILIADSDPRPLLAAAYADQIALDIPADSFVPIDRQSLNNFIARGQHSLTEPGSGLEYANTIRKNLLAAQTILKINEATKNTGIPHFSKESEFGRIYFQGFNLQNQPSIVREAALGDCYKIDINTSVFGWRRWRAAQIMAEQGLSEKARSRALSYTRELIDNKNRIRSHIAQLLFGNTNDHSIRTAKQVLTAIGFGARSRGQSWIVGTDSTGKPVFQHNSMGDIIRSQSLREKLHNDTWVSRFVAEQDAISRLIYDSVKNTPEITSLQILKTDRGHSRNRTLAYLYQRFERSILDRMTDFVGKDQVLLTVHDGFYMRERPDPAIQWYIQQICPDITLEIKHIEPFAPIPIDYSQPTEWEIKHANWIADEERRANKLKNAQVQII